MSEENLGHWASQYNYCSDNKIRTVRWELITINNKIHLFWVGLAVKTGFLSGHRVRNGHFWLLPASSASFPFFGSRIWLSPVVSEREHLMSALISEVTACYCSLHRHWPEGFHFENRGWKLNIFSTSLFTFSSPRLV